MAVCHLHGIGKKRLERIASHVATKIAPPRDKRGRHRIRPNAIPENIVQQVRDHIKSFPRRESHYGRTKSKRFYLSPELNITIMHNLYLKKFERQYYDSLKNKNQASKPVVSYDFYFRYFRENFNCSFGTARTDTCRKCDNLENKIKCTSDEDERKQLKTEKELHLRKSQWFYDELKQRTKEAEENEEIETLCFDYQQNMPLPKVPSGDAFYLRQLWVFNFCIHSAKKKTSHFYMYDETTAKKGCNEVVSFLYHYITNILDKNIKIIYLFSDNCCAQNKNKTLLRFLSAFCKLGRFKSIIHRFPMPGHSFLPCDRSFGLIEKTKRKIDRIYLPKEYKNMVKRVSKKFSVIDVNQQMIFDFSKHLEMFFLPVPKNTNRRKFTISTYRIFQYSQFSDDIECSASTSGYTFLKFSVLKTDQVINLNITNLCYNDALPLKDLKYNNVMTLAKAYVPLADMPFYTALKSDKQYLVDSQSETEEGDYSSD